MTSLSPELDEFLTPTEAAELLKWKTPRPVYDAINRGELAAITLGRTKRIARSDFLGYLNRNRTPASEPAPELEPLGRARSAEDVLG